MLAWFFSFIAFSLHQPRYSKFPCHELVGQSYIYPGLVYHQLQLDRILTRTKIGLRFLNDLTKTCGLIFTGFFMYKVRCF
jgi:hypothetical protein